MRSLLALAIGLALGCTRAPAGEAPSPAPSPPGVARIPAPDAAAAPDAAVAAASITLTSVTFGEDCTGRPAAATMAAPKPAPSRAAPSAVAGPGVVTHQAPVNRRCEQTSMQLVVVGASAADVHIASVDVLDETGKSLGTLTASRPMLWSDKDAGYGAWDEKIGAGQSAQVSYVLSQPTGIEQWARRDRTYTVKVVATVGGVTQPLQTTVLVVGRPAPVPT